MQEKVEKLVTNNLGLVRYVAKQFSSSNVDFDDLVSEGTMGLIKAASSFDETKNVKFSTYSSQCIRNEILMYLRSTKKLNAEVYLNEPIGKDKDDNTITLKEILENDDKPIEEEIELKLRIKKLYEKIKSSLQERERTILELRFGLNGAEPQTQHEIAKEMGISRSYVSRIETKAINKLAKEIKE